MLTAREMEYAAASVGVACNYKHYVVIWYNEGTTECNMPSFLS
jgi:hypothetical protein